MSALVLGLGGMQAGTGLASILTPDYPIESEHSMNFFVAYSRYVRYCKKAGLVKGEYYSLKEFAVIFRENAATNHEGANYA